MMSLVVLELRLLRMSCSCRTLPSMDDGLNGGRGTAAAAPDKSRSSS